MYVILALCPEHYLRLLISGTLFARVVLTACSQVMQLSAGASPVCLRAHTPHQITPIKNKGETGHQY